MSVCAHIFIERLLTAHQRSWLATFHVSDVSSHSLYMYVQLEGWLEASRSIHQKMEAMSFETHRVFHKCQTYFIIILMQHDWNSNVNSLFSGRVYKALKTINHCWLSQWLGVDKATRHNMNYCQPWLDMLSVLQIRPDELNPWCQSLLELASMVQSQLSSVTIDFGRFPTLKCIHTRIQNLWYTLIFGDGFVLLQFFLYRY